MRQLQLDPAIFSPTKGSNGNLESGKSPYKIKVGKNNRVAKIFMAEPEIIQCQNFPPLLFKTSNNEALNTI